MLLFLAYRGLIIRVYYNKSGSSGFRVDDTCIYCTAITGTIYYYYYYLDSGSY